MMTTRYRLLPYLAGMVMLAIIVGLLSPALPTVRAQDGGTNRQISVGDVVTGTLDSETFAQVFVFFASTGDALTIDVTTETEELALIVLVTDQLGNPVVQDIDTSTPTTATIADLDIPSNGSYYITVMRGSGSEGDASGEFTLELTGIQQVGGQLVTVDDGGLVFSLTWAEAVNLNLEIRDPVGGTVHAFRTSTASGGTLDADANVNCDSATANNPTETIAWPSGDVPAGSYEIIIHYIDACNVGGPQEFSMTGNVNNGTAQTVSGTINPGQTHLARLVLDPGGSWSLQNGGVNAGLDVTLFRNEIANADPIAIGSTVSGVITNNEPAVAYTFEGTGNTNISISLEAQSGSLDTYVALLGPDSNPLASNDDNGESTNSFIERSLTTDGTYTIIATRFGLTIGGTEGEFNLSLTTTTPDDGTGTTDTTAPAVEGTTEPAALPQGAIEVQLTWLTNADLQLQVRDPNGETVYDDRPNDVASGGILAEDGNRNCTDTTTAPVSYIYWPENRLQQGVYEVEVWYQNNCNDNTAVNFALTVNVQDQTIINTTQPAILDSRYMITFTVAADGTATVGAGGFFDMTNAGTLSYQTALDTATPITYGGSVSGSITSRQRFELYSFEGETGDIVTISMNATAGTLDPALYLISPEGIQVDFNDDVASGENPNSVIQDAALASTGTYYIIASHYALNVGGTEGTYTLSLVQE